MQSKQIIVSIPQSGGGTDSELEARVTALEEAVGDINTILEEIIGE